MNAYNRYILLVEDNEDDVNLALLALRKKEIDCEVVVKSDGREALNFLQELPTQQKPHSRNPSVILLDISMPELDGLEVLKRIRSEASTRYIPVVMFSSSDEETDIEQSYKFGANSFISKPTNFDNFIEAVQQFGTYWLDLNTTVSA